MGLTATVFQITPEVYARTRAVGVDGLTEVCKQPGTCELDKLWHLAKVAITNDDSFSFISGLELEAPDVTLTVCSPSEVDALAATIEGKTARELVAAINWSVIDLAKVYPSGVTLSDFRDDWLLQVLDQFLLFVRDARVRGNGLMTSIT